MGFWISDGCDRSRSVIRDWCLTKNYWNPITTKQLVPCNVRLLGALLLRPVGSFASGSFFLRTKKNAPAGYRKRLQLK